MHFKILKIILSEELCHAKVKFEMSHDLKTKILKDMRSSANTSILKHRFSHSAAAAATEHCDGETHKQVQVRKPGIEK